MIIKVLVCVNIPGIKFVATEVIDSDIYGRYDHSGFIRALRGLRVWVQLFFGRRNPERK